MEISYSRSMFKGDKPSFAKTERTINVPSVDNILIDNDNYVLTESKHTKTGDNIIVLKIKKTLSRDEYKNVESLIKGIRGYYSGFVKGFILKSALSQNELNNLLRDTPLYSETKLSDDKDINEAAKESVNELVKEEGLSEEQATEQMKKGVEVEMEHKDMLEQVSSGNMDVDTAVAETAEEHIKEKSDYYDKLEQVEKKDEYIFSDLNEAKDKYPIVLEWSEGLDFENKGYDYLYQLEKDLKKAGFTDSPNDTYIKNKIWFRGYPSYVRIDSSKKKSDFDFETKSLEEYLKEYDNSYDFSIYEYGNNYKFGIQKEEPVTVDKSEGDTPSPLFVKGDLAITSITKNNKGSYGYENEKYIGIYGEVNDSYYRDYDFNSGWYYTIKNIFTNEVYHEIPEKFLIKTNLEMLNEENENKNLSEGKLPLLSIDDAKKISDELLGKFKDEDVFETSLVSGMLEEYFKKVVCVRPEYLSVWIELVNKMKSNKEKKYILGSLNSFDSYFDLESYKKQFYNSIIEMNNEKGTTHGVAELSGVVTDVKIYDIKPISYKLDATDDNLYTIIKEFVSDDTLRPALNCFNLNDNGVVATDANKLIFLSGETKQKGNYSRIKNYNDKDYADFKKYKGDIYSFNGKYPNYEVVIPKEVLSSNVFNKESVLSSLSYLKKLIKSNLLHQATKKIGVKITENKECFYVNADFLVDSLTSLIKTGFENLEFTYNTSYNRKTILLISENLDSFVKLKSNGVLLMGILADDSDSSNGSIAEPKFGEMYLDLTKGNIQTKGITDESSEHIATLGELEDYLELIDMTIEAEEDKEAKEDLISYRELIILTIEDLKSKQ